MENEWNIDDGAWVSQIKDCHLRLLTKITTFFTFFGIFFQETKPLKSVQEMGTFVFSISGLSFVNDPFRFFQLVAYRSLTTHFVFFQLVAYRSLTTHFVFFSSRSGKNLICLFSMAYTGGSRGQYPPLPVKVGSSPSLNLKLKSVPYHIRLSSSSNAKINPQYSKILILDLFNFSKWFTLPKLSDLSQKS